METGLDLAGRLIESGLARPRDVLDGSLRVRDLSRRNRNLALDSTGRALHVKRARGPSDAADVRRESVTLRRLRARPELTSVLPALHGHDGDGQLLVLQAVRDGEDLRARHLRTGVFPPTIGWRVGTALGDLHRVTALPHTRPGGEAPWVLSIHRPPVEALRELTPASRQLIAVIQGRPELCALLDGLRGRWREEALIHNDIRWDNIVVASGESAAEASITLVDWEDARDGDPSWDIGSAIAAYLSWWVFWIPADEAVPVEELAGRARFPLSTMRPAVAALWTSYADAAGLDVPARSDMLARAMQMASARLVHTAYEATQASGSLSGHAILHLQLALNVLGRPLDTAQGLLGLSPGR